MSRPKFFRDPVHLQIRFDAVDLSLAPPGGQKNLSWVLQKLIDTPEFQRLRFIRQNGLANLVFHGAEHSRYTHSMGVSHVARVMYERICRNTSEAESDEWKLKTAIAALIHDVGHGPFSHALEEIAKEIDKDFKHEAMTIRFIQEEGSKICHVLKELDAALPSSLVPYFDKSKRVADSWAFRIVSSQLDADRLDYVQRDAAFAGLKGHGFDFERMLDLVHHHENKIAVERGAIEAVEAYLVALDDFYRSIYYHHTVRAATQMLLSLFKRVMQLHKEGDGRIFADLPNGERHPMRFLIEKGSQLPLAQYQKLTEYGMWFLVDLWQSHKDRVLAILATGILTRRLFKAIEIDPSDFKRMRNMCDHAEELVAKHYRDVPEAAKYFVLYDEPSRTSYKRYDWTAESQEESIWLLGRGKPRFRLRTMTIVRWFNHLSGRDIFRV